MKHFYLYLSILFIQACSPSASDNYKSGYNDGYAEGYKTACRIKLSPAKGNWNDENYSKGYGEGQLDGAAKGALALRSDSCKASVYH